MFEANMQAMIVFICVIFVKETVPESRALCDPTANARFSEGNMGEAGVFPWLGILRVHIHEVNTLKIALTGLVLVRDKYAIANADDVAKIPRRIFKEDSKAMFIASDKQPWYCRVRDYMTHPEYEFSTFNTIALLELDFGEEHFAPMKPICWPSDSFNTSNQLYALGYTDENQLLEKRLYKVQYVNPTLCEEFYNRAGLVEGMMTPTHYVCGFAANNRENCVWDNGMALASNSSGVWTLIGFGIRGPGCAAPSRFIDITPYLPWIESATSLYETNVYAGYRKKSAFSEGFKKKKKKVEIKDIPIHELFRGRRRDNRYDGKHFQYPFDTEPHQSRYFHIDRIDKDAIMVTKMTNMIGTCHDYKTTVFHEDTKIVGSKFLTGVVTYKVKCTESEHARLYYTTSIDRKEGTSIKEFGDTPEHLLRLYPIVPTSELNKNKYPTNLSDGRWQPGPNLQPLIIEDDIDVQNVVSLYLLIRFEFKGEGSMKIQMFGPPTPPTTTTEVPINKRTKTPRKQARIGPKISNIKMDKSSFVSSDPAVIGSQGTVTVPSLCIELIILYSLIITIK